MGKDFLQSITEWVHERATSPILSTFTAMWIIINYKVIIVLISETSYLKRFSYLDAYASQDNYYINRLLIPLIITSIYLLLYPIIRNYVYDYWSLQQAEMDNIKVKNFKLKTLSEEEKLELLDANVELKRKYDTDIAERDELINLLNTQVASLKSEANSISKQTKVDDDEIFTTIKLILRKLNIDGNLENSDLYTFMSEVYGVSYPLYNSALSRAAAADYLIVKGDKSRPIVSINSAGYELISD